MFLPKVDGDFIKASNLLNVGFDELILYIKEKLFSDTIRCTLFLPYSKGDIFNVLKEKANIHEFTYENDGIKVDVTLSNYLYNLYKSFHILL